MIEELDAEQTRSVSRDRPVHLDQRLPGNRAARSAIAMALTGLVRKLLDTPVFRLLRMDTARTRELHFTITPDSVDAMVKAAYAACCRGDGAEARVK